MSTPGILHCKETDSCTRGGVPHDFRERTWTELDEEFTALVCVWCNGIQCAVGHRTPCIEVRGHGVSHRAISGVSWALQDTR